MRRFAMFPVISVALLWEGLHCFVLCLIFSACAPGTFGVRMLSGNHGEDRQSPGDCASMLLAFSKQLRSEHCLESVPWELLATRPLEHVCRRLAKLVFSFSFCGPVLKEALTLVRFQVDAVAPKHYGDSLLLTAQNARGPASCFGVQGDGGSGLRVSEIWFRWAAPSQPE